MKYRLHVLGVPHTRSNKNYTACAFTGNIINFCKMMHDLGHYVIHYGVEGADVEADEIVDVVSNEVYDRTYEKRDPRGIFGVNEDNETYREFYKNAIEEIGKRKRPGDILLSFYGCGLAPVIEAHSDMITVQPGVGYLQPNEEMFKYRVWPANMGKCDYYGRFNINNGGWKRQEDIIIPHFFDPRDFIYKSGDQKQDYFLYLGRIMWGKGFDIVERATAIAGVKLVVAGQLDESYKGYKFMDHVEYVGPANAAMRKELMSNARGSLLLSRYNEPFGMVVIENMMSGTPMITSDMGAFYEINDHGTTGYRCRRVQDVVDAINNIKAGKINSADCRKWAEKYSLDAIGPMYEKFFDEIYEMENFGKTNFI